MLYSTSLWVLIVFLIVCHNNSIAQLRSPGAISSYSPGGQYILITFDDGPHYSITPELLRILREKNVKGTFFVQGEKAADHPLVLKSMETDGHEISNGGWKMSTFTKMQLPAIGLQLRNTELIVQGATTGKVTPAFARPPNGLTNMQINQYIKTACNMTVVLWSLDSKDNAPKATKQSIIQAVVKNVKPGDVILFRETQPLMLEALPVIIDYLLEEGYEFLTLSQITKFPDDSPH